MSGPSEAIKIIAAAGISVVAGAVGAQTIDINQLLNQQNSQVVSSLVLLTSQRDLGAGTLRIGDSSDQIKIHSYRLPLSHQFKLPDSDNELTLNGLLAYSRANEDIDFDQAEHDRSRYTTIAIDGAVGVRIKRGNFEFWPQFGLIYARLQNRHDFNSPFSQQLIKPLVDQVATNWKINAYSLNSSLNVSYKKQATPDIVIRLRSNLNVNRIRTFGTQYEQQRIDVSTHYWFNEIGIGRNIRLPWFDRNGFLEASFGRFQLYGEADNGLGTTYVNRIGASLTFETKSQINFLKKLSLDAYYLFGTNLKGLNLGVSSRF